MIIGNDVNWFSEQPVCVAEIIFSNEAHLHLDMYVNEQNCSRNWGS